MKMITCITGILIFLVLSSGTTPPDTRLRVKGGLIQGTEENGLRVFKGIPFAAPPVGGLRWKVPQPVKGWEGVKQTTQYAPAPMQGGNPASGKSEDCLYLNVWTPAKSAKEKVPVLVWIYGGGFSFGSTSDPVHNGEHLARKGVVLVSIAYRVGPYGFLTHPELSAENPKWVSGNYGLLNMIAGLEWVKNNIAAFGGDSGQVTVKECPTGRPLLRKIPLSCMHLGPIPKTGSVPGEASIKVLDEYFRWRRIPEGEAWVK